VGAFRRLDKTHGGAVREVAGSPWLLLAAHSGRAGLPENGTRPLRSIRVDTTGPRLASAKERAMKLEQSSRSSSRP